MNFGKIPSKFKDGKAWSFKLIAVSFFTLLLLILFIRSNHIPSYPQQFKPMRSSLPKVAEQMKPNPQSDNQKTCKKLPPTTIEAFVHYVTSRTIPQQTLKEISVTSKILEQRSPCNFLVFGLGHDSLMWKTLNHGGRTVFLEEDKSWIQKVTGQFHELEAYNVAYDTKVKHADELMIMGRSEECRKVGQDLRFSSCRLSLKGLPPDVFEVEWDLIMIDAPTGYTLDKPGRMGALYTAGMLARNRKSGYTDVFVHDIDRKVEDRFSREFLCEGYMKVQEGRLRHFNIPSFRDGRLDKPFCPYP